MAKSIAEAPLSTSEILTDRLLGTYAIAVLGLTGSKKDFSQRIAREALHKNFSQSDPTMSVSLAFVQDYMYSIQELTQSGWTNDAQEQNRLVSDFASESVAFAALRVKKQPSGDQCDPQLISNAISIGHLNGHTYDSNYATVLIEGANQNIWGSFDNESGLVAELFLLESKEDKRVVPTLLAHTHVFKEALDTQIGVRIGTQYLLDRVRDGNTHLYGRNDQVEANKIILITEMAKSSPALLAKATYCVMDALHNAEYYKSVGLPTYDKSTLCGLTEALSAIWKQLPEELKKGNKMFNDLKESTEYFHPNTKSTDAIAALEQLKDLLRKTLS